MATSSLRSVELLLTSSLDGCLTVFDTKGSPIFHFSGSQTPRKGLALISNKLIATSHISPATGNGSIHLYNWWSPTPFHHLAMPEPVAPLVATTNGLYLFAGGISGRIHSISVPSQRVIRSTPSHDSTPITCLEINSDGSLVFSGGHDGTISAFSTHHLVIDDPFPVAPLKRFHGHESSITGITLFTRQTWNFISCSMDCTIKFWTLNHAKPLFSVTLQCAICDLKMDPLEKEFYGAGSDGRIYRGSLAKRFIPWNEILHEKSCTFTSMAMLNFGESVVSASIDGDLYFWDTRDGKMVRSIESGKSISHLMVIRVTVAVAATMVAGKDGHGGFHRWEMDFGGNNSNMVPSELARETMGMKEELDEAVADRKRSTGVLEKAIGGYERLLSMVLREVKPQGRRTSEVEDGAEIRSS